MKLKIRVCQNIKTFPYIFLFVFMYFILINGIQWKPKSKLRNS